MQKANRKSISTEERRAIEVQLLERFDAFAQEHGLTYWLFWGTLLGAVRHKGLIPWDDDIDIAMPQEDYLRLIELMRKDPLKKEHIRLNAYELDRGYTRPFAKLCDTRTVLYEDFDISYVEEGVCVDVFPLVPVSDVEAVRNGVRTKWRKSFVMLGLSKGRLVPHKSFVKTTAKVLLKPFAMLRGYASFLSQICDDVVNVRFSFGSTSHVLCAEETVRQLDSAWFEGTNYLPFEGMLLPVPGSWDEVLTALYGNYMTLPPESERCGHPSEAYWKDSFAGEF